MTARKKGVKTKKLGLKKESLRREGRLTEADVEQMAGGLGALDLNVKKTAGCPPDTSAPK